MKNSSLITILTLFILFLFSNNAYAYLSSEEQATINILQKNIEVSRKRIADAAGKVYEAKEKIVSAEQWEAKNWTEVQKAMANYTKVAQREISTIDFNLAQLLKIYPSAYIRSFDYTVDFTSEISQLKAANNTLRSKYDRTNSFETQLKKDTKQVKKEMISRTANFVFKTSGVPTSRKDSGENFLNTVSDAFQKGAQIVTSIVTLPFGLYYYALEMKAQVKSLKNNQERLQWINNFRQKTSDAINLSDQGITKLQGWQDSAEKIKDNIKTVNEKIKGYVDQGIKNIKEKKDKALEEVKAKYTFKVEGEGSWPAAPLEPLPASSYTGEALEIIQAIASAVDSAMNGGDPYTIMKIINENDSKLWRERKEADKALKDAYDSYNSAYHQYIQTMQPFWLELGKAMDATSLCDLNECSSYRDYVDAESRAYEKAEAASAQAAPAVTPYALAVEKASRETQRLDLELDMIIEGTYPLISKLSDYTKATRSSFYGLFYLYSEVFRTSTYHVYSLGTAINTLKNHYKKALKDIGHIVVKYSISESGLTSLHAALVADANQLHSDVKELPKLLQEYHKAESEAENLGQKYQQILSDALQKDKLLLVSDDVSGYMHFYRVGIQADSYDKWEPSDVDRDQIYTETQKTITEDFSIFKDKEIDKTATLDFNGLAKKIEERAAQLAQWQDIISLYNARREVAYYLLQAVDHDNVLAKLNNSASYYGATRVLLQKEMNKGSWKSLNTKIENDFKKIKKPVYWSNKLPREKLLGLQSALYLKANKILGNYISAHQHGGFAYATNESDFKSLAQSWIKLKALLKQFDQVAAPMQQKLSKFSSDNFGNIIKPTTSTYNAMPNNIRSLVSVKQNRLMHSFNMLKIYFDLKRTNTRPLTSEDTAKLDEWITSYPVEMKKAKEREAEAKAEQERLRKLRLENARKTLQELATKTTDMIENLKKNTACSKLNSYNKIFNNEIAQQYTYASSLAGKSNTIEANIQIVKGLLNRPCNEIGTEKITNFYNKFKEAYESKDVSAVMEYISNDWSSSADGTSLSDLEMHLENSFRVFDEIQYNISNLNIQPMGGDTFRVSYNVDIIGEIYDNDITHEEQSSVREEVGIKNGKIMILKTFGGRYWSIK